MLRWMECQQKSNEKCTLFYTVFQVFRVLLKKIVRYSHQIFYFLFLILAFTSTENFSQNFSISFNIIWNILYCQIGYNGFSQSPPPLNSQNLLSVTKVFCRQSLTVCATRGHINYIFSAVYLSSFSLFTWQWNKLCFHVIYPCIGKIL